MKVRTFANLLQAMTEENPDIMDWDVALPHPFRPGEYVSLEHHLDAENSAVVLTPYIDGTLLGDLSYDEVEKGKVEKGKDDK